MNLDLSDESTAWRRCELAWSAWLQASGLSVFSTGEAVGNTLGSRAPLIYAEGANRRVPDLQTTSHGVSEFWEVKFRSRVDFDPLTGERVHWMALGPFNDYVAVASATGSKVWIVLYEGPTADSPGRWLRSEITALVAQGQRGERYGLSGLSVAAWIWPAASMEVVPGPEVELGGVPVEIAPPELEVESELAKNSLSTEGALGAGTDASSGNSQSGQLAAQPTALSSKDPLLGLDVLRRELGIPVFPRYSVMLVGLGDVQLETLLTLLHYGIRLFLITDTRQAVTTETVELQAFRECRLLEWSVVEHIPANLNGTWIVDGAMSVAAKQELDRVLNQADEDVDGINVGQFHVVHSPIDLDIVITAGAGTGKTDTMSERLMYLLATCGGSHQEEVDGAVRPFDLRVDDVAFVTFSREAARQMRDRVGQTIMLRQRLCRYCIFPSLAWLMQLRSTEISTIHSFAKHVLQAAGGSLGLGPEVKVSRQTLAIRTMLHDNLSPHLDQMIRKFSTRVPASHLWENHLETIWASLENNGVPMMPSAVRQEKFNDIDWGGQGLTNIEAEVVRTTHKVISAVVEKYREFCLETQSVRTSALIPLALEALQSNQGRQIQPYKYLFVDEFQDTDALQMELLLELKSRLELRLFVVGDVKQGIYRFRGAEGNAFIELNQQAKTRGLTEFAVYSLSRNFRSGARLLESIHPFFSKWSSADLLVYSPSDKLRPVMRQDDESSEIEFAWIDPKEFADESADQVLQWRKENPKSSIAILCRQNWQAMEVKAAIEKKGGYCHLYVGGSFYKTPAVRELDVLLRAVANPQDDAALLQLCETRWGAVLLQAEAPFDAAGSEWQAPIASIMSWHDRFASLYPSGSYDRTDLLQLRQRLESLKSLLRKMPVIAWVVECTRVFRPENTVLPTDLDDAEGSRYSRCLDHLITILDGEFQERPVSIQKLISWIQIQIATNKEEDEPRDDRPLEGVTVALTVHKAKGLQFDRVLIPYTWANFESRTILGTRMTVLRGSNQSPRVLWRWTASQFAQFSNVAPPENMLWELNWKETVREEARLLYVALTRARSCVRVFIPSKGKAKADPARWADLLSYGQ